MELFALTKGEKKRLNNFVKKFASKHNLDDVFVSSYHAEFSKLGDYTFATVKFEVSDGNCNPVFYPIMNIMLEDRRHSSVFMVLDTNGFMQQTYLD